MRFSAAWLVVIVLVLLSPVTQAFTLLPSAGVNGARWRDLPVRYNVNYANAPFTREQVDSILNDAFGIWNSVATSELRVERGEETSVTALDLLEGTTTETAVVFAPDFLEIVPGSNPGVLAVGAAIAVDDEYVQGLIIVNTRAQGVASGNPERLRVVLAHEVGHTFGLGHTATEEALMFPLAQPRGLLAEDDVRGITYLYPRKEPFNALPFGCGGVRNGGGTRHQPLGSAEGALTALAWSVAFVLGWWLMVKVHPVQLARKAEISRRASLQGSTSTPSSR